MKNEINDAAKDFRRKFENKFIPEISERDKIEVAFCNGAEWMKEKAIGLIIKCCPYYNSCSKRVGRNTCTEYPCDYRERFIKELI